MIANVGGPVIDNESKDWIKLHGELKFGSVAFTKGGNLTAKYVIHAAGP